MKNIYKLYIFFFTLLFSSCDYFYSYDFEIINETECEIVIKTSINPSHYGLYLPDSIYHIKQGEKDLFSEMRKYADNFEETAHLAEANEKYEHREKYTGGAGYFLGESKYSGWVVQKDRFYGNREQFIGFLRKMPYANIYVIENQYSLYYFPKRSINYRIFGSGLNSLKSTYNKFIFNEIDTKTINLRHYLIFYIPVKPETKTMIFVSILFAEKI